MCAVTDEPAELNRRLKNEYLGKISTGQASTFISSQRSDGAWADIDYSSQPPSTWPALVHLDHCGPGLGVLVQDHTTDVYAFVGNGCDQ